MHARDSGRREATCTRRAIASSTTDSRRSSGCETRRAGHQAPLPHARTRRLAPLRGRTADRIPCSASRRFSLIEIVWPPVEDLSPRNGGTARLGFRCDVMRCTGCRPASRRPLACVLTCALALRARTHDALLVDTAGYVARSLTLETRILRELMLCLPRATHRASPSVPRSFP